jgi:hypothetical protein
MEGPAPTDQLQGQSRLSRARRSSQQQTGPVALDHGGMEGNHLGGICLECRGEQLAAQLIGEAPGVVILYGSAGGEEKTPTRFPLADSGVHGSLCARVHDEWGPQLRQEIPPAGIALDQVGGAEHLQREHVLSGQRT